MMMLGGILIQSNLSFKTTCVKRPPFQPSPPKKVYFSLYFTCLMRPHFLVLWEVAVRYGETVGYKLVHVCSVIMYSAISY